MGDSKLEFKVGSITFSGEGSGEWLSKQLDKVLAKIPELVAVAPSEKPLDGSNNEDKPPRRTQADQPSGTLAAYLKAKNANESQPRKSLVTAVWLHDTEQKNRISTSEFTEALSKHSQGKLTNPALNLTRNVEKGHCVREGKQFYVTDEGRESLK